ncbi:dehydrogenase [Gordoniibacillus kamchatkensis]|uniref:Dehydrogenase n=1 Tax=Gordoniibacillus kamchatkensis TaxID=1590651 RepID=A0ABR5AGP6_9BACL|nr:bi-domain-containing oxidoreductase [Paenibacillus sp. VKM B-2647]KIL40130.1 dehydrogenase [Paenibacillus sp. VKM B-2647]
MNQILQNLKSGATEIVDVPCPEVRPGHLLIRTLKSVVSVGTERMLVEFGKANLIAKAKQQPDKVAQVIDKIKTDGLVPTLEAVRSKLDQPLTLGYSNIGIILEVGKGVEGFSVGDRVVSNGPHAEVVIVPKNLCAKVPEEVSNEEAAFTVIASIGLQGMRLAEPALGEAFVVTGLGLIGLITVQLLVAQGCRVLGIDYDKERLKLARVFGAEVVDLSNGEDPIASAFHFSKGRGVDGVLITASTKSNEPVHQAAQMCRKRGRIVLVGVTGLELSRDDFYKKELSFQVSCSYGPGRYDSSYEEKGHDYPFGFVRWTEQRNFEAILDMLAERRITFAPLITNRYPIENADEAYKLLSNSKAALGIVLDYDHDKKDEMIVKRQTVQLLPLISNRRGSVESQQAVVGFIGAGNFTSQVLLPAIQSSNASLKSIASSGGVTGVHVGKKFGFHQSTTNANEIITDHEINTVFITTRHNTHAKYVREAILAGKHVFVEKPLCLTREELEHLQNIQFRDGQILMVGFNRRFSPHAQKIKQLLTSINEPKTMIMTVNAGHISEDHWTQDPLVGGGRIIGEACHFVDLLRYLIGYPIIKVTAAAIGENPVNTIRDDKMTFTLTFEDGSIGTVHYFANGHKSFPKEKLTVFAAGKILELNNFKMLTGYGWPNFKKQKLWRQDKGHRGEIQTFFDAIQKGGGYPIPLNEIFEVTEACFDIVEQGMLGNKKNFHMLNNFAT